MKFPYINGEPIIPFEVKGIDGKWYELTGYLDSGAGYSVFHEDHVKLLGLDIYKGRKIILTVGNGSNITTYIHKLNVKFAEKQFIAEISFSPDLGVGTNIIPLFL